MTVVLDGQPQSAVDLDDPERLDFEYVQHLALCIDALAPAGPLRVTHVGGAGLTLPRWVQHTRPGSPQVVLEPDAALTEAVRRELPLPRGHRIRVRPVDGLAGVAALRDASADVVVVDAYAAGRVPPELVDGRVVRRGRARAGAGWAAGRQRRRRAGDAVRRAGGRRRTGGARARRVRRACTRCSRARRFGNLVLVGSTGPLDLWTLRRATASAALPTGVLSGDEHRAARRGARPFSAADGGHGRLTGAARAGRLAPPLTWHRP